jgi:hypothetical protein
MTRRKNIIDEIKTTLESILISGGYETDAGNSVFLDKSEISESTTFPAININETSDNILSGENTVWPVLSLPIDIEAYAECLPSTANTNAHELIGDIKTAIFTHTPVNYSHHNYISSEIGQRESGSGLVAVNVSITIVYKENINAPAT